MTPAGKWGDLPTRLLSGIVVSVLGIGAVVAGGLPLQLLAVLVAGVSLWELARLTAPDQPARALMIGLAAGLFMAVPLVLHSPFWLAGLILPALFGLIGPRNDRRAYGLYALAIMPAVYAFVAFREGYGLGFAIWLVLVVIASDVLGYFGGRMLGGPKFWPRLSPKKTWSGTIAGWLGAGAVGMGFAIAYHQPWCLAGFSALTALAAQMGDIAESAIKRRAGVKDASNLIPGHGGLLDRIDGLIGAAVFVLAWGLLRLPLPVFEG